MEVHEVVDNTTLEVVANAVDDDLLPHVHNLEEGQILLVAVFVERLVHLFVVAYAIAEVESGRFGILALVIGTGGLDVANVHHDHVLVVTLGLNKDDLNVILRHDVEYPFAPFFCAVGGIEDTDDSALLKPPEHVGYRGLSGSAALALSLLVVGIEEVGRRLGSICASVVADIEGGGGDREPGEVALRWKGRELAIEPYQKIRDRWCRWYLSGR